MLAGGISEALVTTAAGLTVAIPSLIAYRYLRGRVDGLVVKIEKESIRFIEALLQQQRSGVLEWPMKLQSRSREEPEINVISLVDVLLVLVLFFMVSTSFLRETEISLQLPEATIGRRRRRCRRDARDHDHAESGTYLVNGRELVNNERRTLRAAIERLAGAKRDLPVFIRADAAATHQAVDHGDGRRGAARLRQDQHRHRHAA